MFLLCGVMGLSPLCVSGVSFFTAGRASVADPDPVVYSLLYVYFFAYTYWPSWNISQISYHESQNNGTFEKIILRDNSMLGIDRGSMADRSSLFPPNSTTVSVV
jgi:hypothetical protein